MPTTKMYLALARLLQAQILQLWTHFSDSIREILFQGLGAFSQNKGRIARPWWCGGGAGLILGRPF